MPMGRKIDRLDSAVQSVQTIDPAALESLFLSNPDGEGQAMGVANWPKRGQEELEERL